MKFALSIVESLTSCRPLLYTFQDVLCYRSNAVNEVAATSHAGPLVDRTVSHLGHLKQL